MIFNMRNANVAAISECLRRVIAKKESVEGDKAFGGWE